MKIIAKIRMYDIFQKAKRTLKIWAGGGGTETEFETGFLCVALAVLELTL
jgi:hypothetical protein